MIEYYAPLWVLLSVAIGIMLVAWVPVVFAAGLANLWRRLKE